MSDLPENSREELEKVINLSQEKLDEIERFDQDLRRSVLIENTLAMLISMLPPSPTDLEDDEEPNQDPPVVLVGPTPPTSSGSFSSLPNNLSSCMFANSSRNTEESRCNTKDSPFHISGSKASSEDLLRYSTASCSSFCSGSSKADESDLNVDSSLAKFLGGTELFPDDTLVNPAFDAELFDFLIPPSVVSHSGHSQSSSNSISLTANEEISQANGSLQLLEVPEIETTDGGIFPVNIFVSDNSRSFSNMSLESNILMSAEDNVEKNNRPSSKKRSNSDLEKKDIFDSPKKSRVGKENQFDNNYC